MTTQRARSPFGTLAISERIALAKEKCKCLVDHVLYLIELHANNEIIIYSPTLSSQIPTSFAANAFNVFQRGMHQFEIVRLCAIWDRAELKKENIPTVIELIDHPEVIEVLAEKTAAQWKSIGGHIFGPSDSPQLRALEEMALQRSNEEFGDEQAQKARYEIRKAIDDSRTLLSSQKYASIMNLRDKHLAHSLSETRREKRVGALPPVKYGDEREILDQTLPIVQSLYCWVCGTSFSFEESMRIDRRNAKSLWESCQFTIRD